MHELLRSATRPVIGRPVSSSCGAATRARPNMPLSASETVTPSKALAGLVQSASGVDSAGDDRRIAVQRSNPQPVPHHFVMLFRSSGLAPGV